MPEFDNKSQFMTTTEASNILGVSRNIIKTMIETGELETWYTPGGHRRIKLSSIKEALSKQSFQSQPLTFEEISNLQIIVISSDPLTKTTFQNTKLIDERPFTVDFAANGYEGLLSIGMNQYDMIFIDIDTPLMNGIEVTQAIRKQPQISTNFIFLFSSEFQQNIDYKNTGTNTVLIDYPIDKKTITQFIKYELLLKKCRLNFEKTDSINKVDEGR